MTEDLDYVLMAAGCQRDHEHVYLREIVRCGRCGLVLAYRISYGYYDRALAWQRRARACKER